MREFLLSFPVTYCIIKRCVVLFNISFYTLRSVPRRGRPAKSRIDKQKRVVSTKLTELQYYAIKKRAGESGLPVSEYVRQAVVSAEITPRLNRQDADTIRKLAGEANNINQLAHRANAGGFALVAVELVKLKNRIVEIINQLSDDWKNKKGKRI